jgi:RNA polymerase sigma-70 factor (ECF subfamily)
MLGGAVIAEDLVQDAFVAAFERFDRYNPACSFVGWMRAIVRHRFLRYLNDRRRRELSYGPSEMEELVGDERDWDEVTGLGEERRALLQTLRECLQILPSPSRRLVELCYFENLSGAEIGRRLNLSEGNVRQQLFRSRAKLKKMMSPKLRELALAA